MSERIKDKIDEIEKYLSELTQIIPLSLDEYKEDFRAKAACERYAERIIEAIVDLAFIFIKEKKLQTPESDLQTFDILAAEKVISKELAEKFKEAKGMRNIIAHEYGEVNDKIVFSSISEELEEDVEKFIDIIKKYNEGTT